MTRAHIRIDFSNGSSVGPGKVGLLEAIEKAGSLSAAARNLDMSYRRAWLLVHSVNTAFQEAAVVLSTGGVEGGGARLTDFGKKLVADYREFQGRVDAMAQEAFTGVRANRSPAAKPAVKRRAVNRPVTGTARRR